MLQRKVSQACNGIVVGGSSDTVAVKPTSPRALLEVRVHTSKEAARGSGLNEQIDGLESGYGPVEVLDCLSLPQENHLVPELSQYTFSKPSRDSISVARLTSSAPRGLATSGGERIPSVDGRGCCRIGGVGERSPP
jgi:hypothetical protein